jgi:hypothetical protein
VIVSDLDAGVDRPVVAGPCLLAIGSTGRFRLRVDRLLDLPGGADFPGRAIYSL